MTDARTFTSTNTFVQRLDMTSALVDESLVVAQLETGNYYTLEATSLRIWELLAEPRTLDDLCRCLMSEYAVDRAVCEADVRDALAALDAAHLITVAEQGPADRAGVP